MNVPAASTDLSAWIRPGDTVAWGQAGAEPLSLVAAFLAQRQRFAPVRALMGIGYGGLVQPEHADAIDFVSYCATGGNRALAQQGVLDILPAHYGQWSQLIRSQALKVDVLLLQVSPPDEQGRYSYGCACDYLPAARSSARVVIAEINEQAPWTHADHYLTRNDFDAVVHASYPPSTNGPANAALSPAEMAIGQHVAGLIEDGATLQLGLGNVPDAVLHALGKHKDLGLHSGAATDGVVDLIESGVMTHARKTLDAGVGVAGVLLGGPRLFAHAHRNRTLQLRTLDYTHSASVLGALDRFTAINTAIEVDVSGQINAEMAAGRYVGAIGGAPAFLQGAQASWGGLPIVALPSTAGSRSRIVANLNGPVSTARCDAGLIVTEHGVADLRAQTLSQRFKRLLAITAPEHREALSRDAHAQWRSAGIHWTQRLGD